MANYAYFDNILQYGLGIGANVQGQLYDLYRVTNKTPSAGVLSGLPLFTNVPISLRKSPKTVIEGESFSLLTDDGIMQLGDILVEQTTPNGYYAVAQLRPLAPTLFVRVEQTATLVRDIPEGGSLAEQPQSGVIFNNNYGGTTAKSSNYAQCVNGIFTFTASASSAAAFPINLTPTQRVKELRHPDLPDQLPNQQYIAYIPYLPGLDKEETDKLVMMDGSGTGYEIVQIYDSLGTGLSGSICIVNEVDV
jgi:hypothetical protein